MSYTQDEAGGSSGDLLADCGRISRALAEAFQKADAVLARAITDQSRDKARRRGKAVASLIDALVVTPAECAVRSAAEAKSKAFEKLRQEARAVTRQETLRRVAESDQGALHEAKMALWSRREARFEVIRSAAWACEDAIKALGQAQSACEAASSTELLDATSSSQMVSWMSSASTFRARSAMESAAEAVDHLRTVIPSCVADLRTDELDDTTDLVLDLVVDLPFDFASWSNLAALSDAVEACRTTAAALGPLRVRLRGLREDAARMKSLVFQEVMAIEAPFAEQARDALLAELGPDLRESLAPHLEPGP